MKERNKCLEPITSLTLFDSIFDFQIIVSFSFLFFFLGIFSLKMNPLFLSPSYFLSYNLLLLLKEDFETSGITFSINSYK